MFSSALMTAVAIVTLAESPWTPSYDWTYWMWMSFSEIPSSENFLMIAETFWTASSAMSWRLPVAITSPGPWLGVTSAITGITMPESSPMTARPLTRPTTAPSLTVSS